MSFETQGKTDNETLINDMNKRKEEIVNMIEANNYNQAMTLLLTSKSIIEEYIKEITPKPIPKCIGMIFKQTVSNLALCAFKMNQYEKSIEFDKFLLQIDEHYDKCYARLFKSYLALNQRQDAVLYGAMLKTKFKHETLQKYSELLPLINQEIELYQKESSTWHILPPDKRNPVFYFKIFLILCSIAYIIWCFMHKKELARKSIIKNQP